MSPNITTDVLRAQCAELRQQMQAMAHERDRWRDQAKSLLALLPERLERNYQHGLRDGYVTMLKWCQRHGGDSVEARIHRELAALEAPPARRAGCDWCLGRGYTMREERRIICPCCNAGLPISEKGTES